MSEARRQSLAAFRHNESGTIAIIFAICCFFLVMVTGLAIDVGRAMHANQKISDALDSAALAAAKGMRDQNLTDGEVEALAKKYFVTNLDGTGANYANVSELRVGINRGSNSIALDVDAEVPTLFANIAGISKIAFPKSAVAIFDKKDVEVSLQLDVTGSMHGRKLGDLKEAVGDLLDILLPDSGTTSKMRIALAPFSAGVNAGAFAGAVSNGRSSNGCVYERRNSADQDTDVAPVGKAALKGNLDLPGAGACSPNARVLPLSDDKDLLRRTVNAYTDRGSTAGHLGSAWAWYLVSPSWSAIFPASARPANYNDGRTVKYAILMTDGIYNTIEGRSDGDHGSTARRSASAAIETCEAMKAKGIIVYTIGFEAPSDAKDTLRACASSRTKFYDASNGDQLRAAFRDIASEINNLRLSQ